MKIYFFFIFIFLWSVTNTCSHQPALLSDHSKPGHFRLYSQPEEPKLEDLPQHIKRIVIVGTNDFHGNLDETIENAELLDGTKREIKIGGAEYISSYFSILRKKFPNQVLLTDAGDIFQGTLVSNNVKGESVIEFYNYLNYDALTIGNHEFDYGPFNPKDRNNYARIVSRDNEDPQGALKFLTKKSKAPFVATNIYDIIQGQPIKWDGVVTSYIKKINGINVGILGATTIETPDRTIRPNVRGLNFQNITDAVLLHSEKLKKSGAQIVILIAHAGGFCGRDFSKTTKLPIEKVNFTPQDYSLCEPNEEIFKVAQTIGPRYLDGIVAGHTHSKIANFINGVPIIQSFSDGKFFGRFDLFFDTKENKLLREKTFIYQPVKVCQTFFRSSEDCYTKDNSMDHTELRIARFLGEEVKPDEKVTKILKPYRDKVSKLKNEKLIEIGEALLHDRYNESALGNLITDGMRHVAQTQIAMTNAGGIRSSLNSGIITYELLFKVIPFNNYLIRMNLKGEELKRLVQIATSGHDAGLGYFSGLKIYLNEKLASKQSVDLNQNGVLEKWENNRLASITLENGELIEDEKDYSFVTNTYVGETGGDGYGHVFDLIPMTKKIIDYENTYRDAVATYLKDLAKKSQLLNTTQKPYWTMDQSRVIFQ